MNEELHIQTAQKTREINPHFNPFPGLRPFSIEESHLFFGREGQSDEVLQNLADNKFVAVIGASGSGKSSLMYCGLVPILHGGFITEVGSNWQIIPTRPGNGPIHNLAESIVKSTAISGSSDQEINYSTAIVESVLRSSSKGLVEAIGRIDRAPDENVLVLVDQFEELFRYKRKQANGQSFNESFAFVKLLVEAARQKDVPLYIVLTMRSDFIGECAQYQELTKLINDSHYLIPQMTRDNLRNAITGPVAVGGGAISPRLLHQLLNDVGDNPDQLPILQHALMRTWSYWEKFRKENEPLDISHYEAIGRMEKALSEHANEAYDELSQRGKEICEHLFKSLTERGADNRGIRRPSSIKEICAIANAKPDEVIEVVEVFRKPGRSFLSPAAEFKLSEETVVDISHESLMRIWDKLKIWVEEEASAVQMYLRLSEAAAMYQQGEAGLWRPPDLHLATAWREKQKPTLAWAVRYNPAFERAMVYLETSEKEFRAEEENKIRLQKRTLRRSRNVAIILGVAAIFSLGATIFAFVQQLEAKNKEILANEREKEANEQRTIAEASSLEAERQRREAEKRKEEALFQQQLAEEQKQLAEFSAKEAVRQKELALQKQIEANEQRSIALESSKEALAQKENAEVAKEEAYRLRMLSISQSMAVKSLQIEEDRDQKALFAYHAYKFNKDYEGSQFDNDIYNGLYYSLKQFPQEKFRFEGGHEDAVEHIVFDSEKNIFFSAGSDGNLLKWRLDDRTEAPTVLRRVKGGIDALAMSYNGCCLAYSKKNGDVELINMQIGSKGVEKFKGHKQEVKSIRFLRNENYMITASEDSTIRAWDYMSGKGWVLAKCPGKVKDVVVSDDHKLIAAIVQNAGIVIWQTENLKEDIALSEMKVFDADMFTSIQSVVFDRSGNYLISGDKQGTVIVWDARKQKQLFKLRGHKARISDLEFNEDGTILASSSFDGTVRLWQTIDFTKEPIVLKDHESWVLSIAFSPDGRSLVTGCSDSRIKEWYVNTSSMADLLYSRLTRNMKQNEWDRYIGEDINYEKARKDLQ